MYSHVESVDLVTTVLLRLSRTGRVGSSIGAAIDLMRSTGLRYAMQRLSERKQTRRDSIDPYDRVYERIWSDAAHILGAKFTGIGDGIFEIQSGRRLARVWRQWSGLDDPISYRISLNRPLSNRLLHEAGLRTPEHLAFDLRSLEQAASFLAENSTPGVVKPANGTGGGWCITAQVRSQSHLLRAAILASRLDRNLIVERQVSGEVYRFLLLDGELVDVVHRTSPVVVGDGRSRISELIAAENQQRYQQQGDEGLSEVTATLDCVLTLQAQGLTLASVPRYGRAVTIKTVTNQSGPERNHTVRAKVCDAIISDARRCAQVIGLRLAGIDIITPTLELPLGESGGAIIEVNGGPGLHHHYHVSNRKKATRVAVPILEKLLHEAA